MSIKQTAFIVGVVAVVGVIAITLTIVIARGNLPPPEITLTSYPTKAILGNTAKISWSVNGADSCMASGDWVGERNPVSGSERVTLKREKQTYVLACEGQGGTAEKVVDTVAQQLLFSFTADKNRAEPRDSIELQWEVSGLTRCTAWTLPRQFKYSGGWNGSVPLKGSKEVIVSNVGTVTFRLVCSSGGGVKEERFIEVLIVEDLLDKKEPLSYEEYFRTDGLGEYGVYFAPVSKVWNDGITATLSIAPDVDLRLRYDQSTAYFLCGEPTKSYPLTPKKKYLFAVETLGGGSYATAINACSV